MDTDEHLAWLDRGDEGIVGQGEGEARRGLSIRFLRFWERRSGDDIVHDDELGWVDCGFGS